MQKTSAQCDGIRRWGLREKVAHEGGALMNGISSLTKEAPESSLHQSEDQGEGCSLEEGPHLTMLHLDLRLPAPEQGETDF